MVSVNDCVSLNDPANVHLAQPVGYIDKAHVCQTARTGFFRCEYLSIENRGFVSFTGTTGIPRAARTFLYCFWKSPRNPVV
jgi:hypothetical protein